MKYRLHTKPQKYQHVLLSTASSMNRYVTTIAIIGFIGKSMFAIEHIDGFEPSFIPMHNLSLTRCITGDVSYQVIWHKIDILFLVPPPPPPPPPHNCVRTYAATLFYFRTIDKLWFFYFLRSNLINLCLEEWSFFAQKLIFQAFLVFVFGSVIGYVSNRRNSTACCYTTIWHWRDNFWFSTEL